MPTTTHSLAAPAALTVAQGRHMYPERPLEGRLVLVNTNHLYKLGPGIVDVWANINRRVRDSVLWLVQTYRPARDMVTKEARARGMGRRSIAWSMRVGITEHIARTTRADLFLDTPLYNAHTVATDTLWAGVPLLTIVGETMSSRVGLSIVSAVFDHSRGSSALAMGTVKEYEDGASRLAMPIKSA